MAKTKESKGITLIALILTMIILLILASVVLSIVLNSDSLIEKTNVAKEEWNKVIEADENMIEDLIYMVKSREKVDSTDNIFIAISEPNWTSDDITLVLSYDDIPVGYKIQYKIGDGPWQDGREILITDNTIVAVRLYNDIIDYETAVNTITINNIDKVAPTDPVTIEVVANINSIEVRATGGNDEKSGVAGYIYSLDNEHWSELVGVNDVYTFDNIKADTDVTIYAKTVDNAGLESESLVQEGKTTTITSNVNIEQDTSDWTNGDVEITLSYDDIPENYEIQYKIGDSDWTEIENGGTVAVGDNETVIVRLYNEDLDDEIGTNTITITNIDKEPPTAPTVVQIAQATTSSLIVQASGATDNGENVIYEYKIDNSDNWVPENGTSSAYTFTNVTDGEEHTIYARAVDRAKNRSESTISNSFTIAHIGGTHANGGTCTTCGQVYQTHTWGDWGRITDPTCTAKGQDTRTCSCGAKDYRDVAALGHTGQTHANGGKCTRCNTVYVTHSWGGWGRTKDPTCTAKGQDTRTCSCGAKDYRDVAALGHSTPTSYSTDSSNHWKLCTRCSTTLVSKTAHSGATFQNGGYCTTCNYGYLTGTNGMRRLYTKHLYYVLLGRDIPDTGPECISWQYGNGSQIAYGVGISTEAYNRYSGQSVSTVVTWLYRGILNREPDSGGLNYLVSAHGNNYIETIREMINSTEFQNLCNSKGLGWQAY